MTTTIRTYSVGQRVVVPGTPNHSDPVVRNGGPGAICNVYPPRTYAVLIDGQRSETGWIFDALEIKPEPTV